METKYDKTYGDDYSDSKVVSVAPAAYIPQVDLSKSTQLASEESQLFCNRCYCSRTKGVVALAICFVISAAIVSVMVITNLSQQSSKQSNGLSTIRKVELILPFKHDANSSYEKEKQTCVNIVKSFGDSVVDEEKGILALVTTGSIKLVFVVTTSKEKWPGDYVEKLRERVLDTLGRPEEAVNATASVVKKLPIATAVHNTGKTATVINTDAKQGVATASNATGTSSKEDINTSSSSRENHETNTKIGLKGTGKKKRSRRYKPKTSRSELARKAIVRQRRSKLIQERRKQNPFFQQKTKKQVLVVDDGKKTTNKRNQPDSDGEERQSKRGKWTGER